MLPALIAAVQSSTGTVTGIQRIYLNPAGGGKAQVADPKKSLGTALALLAIVVIACGRDRGADRFSGANDEPVVVYSGRNESLIGPLLQRFTEATGIDVKVRYGGTAELTATLLAEGENTPANLFISQDAAALGALSDAGRLLALAEGTLAQVPDEFRSAAGDWVGLSGRARTIVYNTALVDVAQLPLTLEEATEPAYRGRFGLAPTNGSFQAHMAAYYEVAGAVALGDLLRGLVANECRRYPKNSSIVDAVIAGEIEWGFVNHYYLWRALRENPDAQALNYFMPGGGASGFVNVAGVGVLSEHPGARRLVRYLLSDDAQSYFAEETFEYPLVVGVAAAAGLPPLDSLAVSRVDFGRIAAVLENTLTLIGESGLIR